MKKILFIVIFVLAFIANSTETQAQSSSSSFLGRAGYSWVSGMIGAEYQFNNIGLGLGWMPNAKPLSGEKVNSITYNITFYGGEWDESAFYISAGGATNGFQLETSSTGGYYNYESSAGFILTGGYKFAWNNMDLRLGGGWGWGLGMSVGTIDITLGVRLSKK